MKTIEELCKEISASEELQKLLEPVNDKASLEAFLKEQGCSATADEFEKFVKSRTEGEIGDDAAAEVAGGWDFLLFKRQRDEKSLRA